MCTLLCPAVAESICGINSTVETGNPKATLLALKGYAACIRSITDDCAETYVEKLTEARKEKAEFGECVCVCVCVCVCKSSV